MPLPKEVLESLKHDIDEAEESLKEVKDVVTDMRLAGMDTAKLDSELETLKDEIRKRRILYDRQKAKSS